MTKNAKLKKAIRERAARTGERYAAARRQVLMAHDNERLAAMPKAGAVSDEKSREVTGKSLAHWFRVLDDWGGKDKGHTACAKHLASHGVPPWYCQGITVAYERTRGLREAGQTCDGKYEASVSRALPVSMAEAMAAIAKKASRRKWIDGALGDALEAGLKKKKLAPTPSGGYARVRFPCADAKVELSVNKKGDRSSVVAVVSHPSDKSACQALRAQWAEALDALRGYLKEG